MSDAPVEATDIVEQVRHGPGTDFEGHKDPPRRLSEAAHRLGLRHVSWAR
jgi:hypothetical protein